MQQSHCYNLAMIHNCKKPTSCRLYIIRHGETEWNLEHRLQGQKDSCLTANGLAQAKERAKNLAKIYFDEIFSSDLLRAKQTAEIIALEHKLAVKTNQLLRERSFGKYEGTLITEFETELKEMLHKQETLSEKEQFSFKLSSEVESDEEIVTRMITFVREIAAAYLGKTVAVVCHGSIMRSFLVHLGFGNYSELRFGAIGNLGYFILETDGVDFFVRETEGITLAVVK